MRQVQKFIVVSLFCIYLIQCFCVKCSYSVSFGCTLSIREWNGLFLKQFSATNVCCCLFSALSFRNVVTIDEIQFFARSISSVVMQTVGSNFRDVDCELYFSGNF